MLSVTARDQRSCIHVVALLRMDVYVVACCSLPLYPLFGVKMLCTAQRCCYYYAVLYMQSTVVVFFILHSVWYNMRHKDALFFTEKILIFQIRNQVWVTDS